MSEVRTLRPGLLVSMNTSIRGNTQYQVTEIEADHLDANGEKRARWETTRTIADPEEHEAAIKLRTKVRGLILSVCVSSAFGLLCRESDGPALTQAIAEGRQWVDEFNLNASLTRVSFNVIYGRIAQDDVEAVKAISEELRNLMQDMQAGIANMDVKAVRDAANKATSVGQMLSPGARGRLDVAIEAARKSARLMVKAGESAALEIDRAAIAKIDMARTSFLDIDIEASDIAAPAMSGRALDL